MLSEEQWMADENILFFSKRSIVIKLPVILKLRFLFGKCTDPEANAKVSPTKSDIASTAVKMHFLLF